MWCLLFDRTGRTLAEWPSIRAWSMVHWLLDGDLFLPEDLRALQHSQAMFVVLGQEERKVKELGGLHRTAGGAHQDILN